MRLNRKHWAWLLSECDGDLGPWHYHVRVCLVNSDPLEAGFRELRRLLGNGDHFAGCTHVNSIVGIIGGHILCTSTHTLLKSGDIRHFSTSTKRVHGGNIRAKRKYLIPDIILLNELAFLLGMLCLGGKSFLLPSHTSLNVNYVPGSASVFKIKKMHFLDTLIQKSSV